MTFHLKPIRAALMGILTALLMGMPGKAEAACSTTSGTVNLGTVGSFTAAATAQTSAGTTGFTCSGSLLSIISTNTVTATIASATNSQGTQPRLYNAASGDYISYDICKNFSCSSTHSIGSQIVWSSTTFAGILGLFNASDGSLPIYIRTFPGMHVAAGTYTGTITLNWSWRLCAVGIGALCIYDEGTATSTVAVTMIISADCILSAPPLNFGSAAFVGSFDPVVQSLTIRCSKDAAYSVGISDGQHYAGNRRLSDGSNYIAYEIYYPQGSISRWGQAGAERRSSAEATSNAGVYSGTADQTFTYRASILSGQATPPPGTYTDTLTIDVQF